MGTTEDLTEVVVPVGDALSRKSLFPGGPFHFHHFHLVRSHGADAHQRVLEVRANLKTYKYVCQYLKKLYVSNVYILI